MKTILPLLLVLWTNTFAQEVFLIDGIENHPNRDGVFNLQSPDHPGIQVDCASFLFGITLTDQQRNDFLYLYQNECHYIVETLFEYQDFKQPACLGLHFSGKDWRLWKSDGDCP